MDWNLEGEQFRVEEIGPIEPGMLGEEPVEVVGELFEGAGNGGANAGGCIAVAKARGPAALGLTVAGRSPALPRANGCFAWRTDAPPAGGADSTNARGSNS